MPEPRLAIVIVNYRTPRLTVDCLRSLAAERARECGIAGRWQVVVTDNASGDDSVREIECAVAAEGWGDWCQLLPLPRNGGFAYGNNAAVESLLTESPGPTHIWLLNPDTTVCPGTLPTVMSTLAGSEARQILGTEVINPDGSSRRSAFRFPTALGELEAAAGTGLLSRLLRRWSIAPANVHMGQKVDWVSGASMVVPAEVFREVGLLDESYFMYYEETDLCLRAARAGWQCQYLGAAPIVHIVGQSSGVTSAANRSVKRRPKYWFESRNRYFQKNHGRLYAFMVDLAWFAGLVVGRLYCAVRRKPWPQPPRLIADAIRYGYFDRRRDLGSAGG